MAWTLNGQQDFILLALQFQSFMGGDVSKRQLKEIFKRIRWLCSRCDFSYELPAKRFGLEQTVLVRRLELPPKAIALCFSLSEGLKYLEIFYNDVRTQQKAFRKEDKFQQSRILDSCTKVGMACSYTKRTRLNPPSYRIYDPAEYANVLGPKFSVDEVQSLFKIERSDLSNTTPPSRKT